MVYRQGDYLAELSADGGVVAVPPVAATAGACAVLDAADFFFLGILISLNEWLRLNLLMST